MVPCLIEVLSFLTDSSEQIDCLPPLEARLKGKDLLTLSLVGPRWNILLEIGLAQLWFRDLDRIARLGNNGR